MPPNTQQLNKTATSDAKALFKPRKGNSFLLFDYSQIEFRLIVHFINDLKTMQLGRLKITVDRWPWQRQPNYRLLGRFGGGWDWCIGIQVAKSGTILLNLIYGQVMISLLPRKDK